ncbi:heme-dependent oxidative N-demethylase family protein [Acinetobacter puyangensis]|uniref:heme-dependent oxidative N-demethylase family protein n=1 Tax=Acinetobacter puyangensis TaxID=1096779 RepID=UPI003A4E4ADE
MSIQFNLDESMRGQFKYHNSPKAIQRFPFPFPEDSYMYSVNLEPALAKPDTIFAHWFDIDEHYLTETNERALTLASDPNRCIILPHMQHAAWDLLEMAMLHLSQDYPDLFQLQRDGKQWHWVNLALNIDVHFTFGDANSLPLPPFEFISRQLQGDIAMLDQRDGDLWMDAGMITGPADWSLNFDAGMSFTQWHAPVPKVAHDLGVFKRALQFLLNIQVDNPYRRLNWTMTINPRMDTSSETYHLWGHERSSVTLENVGELVHLRVELQFMPRLARSNALLFSIRTYLISLNDLVSNPEWAKRLHRVLRDLPDEIAEYKGITRYRPTVVQWLSQFDQA